MLLKGPLKSVIVIIKVVNRLLIVQNVLHKISLEVDKVLLNVSPEYSLITSQFWLLNVTVFFPTFFDVKIAVKWNRAIFKLPL